MTVRLRHGARLSRWCAAAACGLLAVLVGMPPAYADATRDRQWHLRALNVAEAHKVSKGSGVVVAVVDTGVKADHRDLVGNVLPGIDFTGADSRGQQDTDGHGSAMAGLIAAHGHGRGGADGALGIAPAAKILPIRNGTTMYNGDPNRLPDAIDQAVQRGAKVVSLSLTGGTYDRLREAVRNALAADVVVVAATGNRPDDVVVGYPAAYPGVLAVGATGRNGRLAPVSATGKEMVLTAPGVDIMAIDHTGSYGAGTGTSNSTAIVAGAVALVRSKFPDLSATEVVHRLTATATDRGAPGRDPEYGYGVLNLVGALTADVKPAETQPSAEATPSRVEPSLPAAAPPTIDASAPLKLSTTAYVIGGLCLLLVLLGGGVLGWLLIRAGRRRRSPPQHPGAPGHPPGTQPVPPAGYPVAPPTQQAPPGYPAPGYPPSGYPPTPGYPPPGSGQPGQPRPPNNPGPPYPGG